LKNFRREELSGKLLFRLPERLARHFLVIRMVAENHVGKTDGIRAG
jgi:hypothetical protein